MAIISKRLAKPSHLEHIVAFELGADALRLPPLLRRLEPVRRYAFMTDFKLSATLTDERLH